MISKPQKFLMNFFNLPVDKQDELLDKYNVLYNSKLFYYDISPLKTDDPRLLKFAEFLEKNT